MTPEEAYTSVKPKASHLRIFGCPVYINVPKEKSTKLEPTSRRGIFVGYSESSKAYRIYFPGQRQIEVSRDLTFEEEVAYRRSSGSHAETDSEEQESPREFVSSSPHPTAARRDPMESDGPCEPIDPIDMVVLNDVLGGSTALGLSKKGLLGRDRLCRKQKDM